MKNSDYSQSVTDQVYNSHSQKHQQEFAGKDKFSSFKPETQKGMKDLINRSLTDKSTKGFKGQDNRDVYVSDKYNMMVIHNKNEPDKSTFARTDKPEKKLNTLFNKDIKKGGSPDKTRIKEGGVSGLYPNKSKEPSQIQKNITHSKTATEAKGFSKLSNFSNRDTSNSNSMEKSMSKNTQAPPPPKKRGRDK